MVAAGFSLRSTDDKSAQHKGCGYLENAIRRIRKENLMAARQERLAYYNSQRKGVSDYEVDKKSGSNGIVGPYLETQKVWIGPEVENKALEGFNGGGDFQTKSSAVLCQNR